ncbi:hypothetical protein GCM10022226_73160 [Sphaerisporangium flaviroseum]|uniref:Uncharacterized protein n=1 Tax=Sphaerisporangium flaviroseum TaxID=509199 RepID=A0ABP7JC36_9ACTN
MRQRPLEKLVIQPDDEHALKLVSRDLYRNRFSTCGHVSSSDGKSPAVTQHVTTMVAMADGTREMPENVVDAGRLRQPRRPPRPRANRHRTPRVMDGHPGRTLRRPAGSPATAGANQADGSMT